MSMQAPFVDAATSIDPTNRDNRFISYYTWGSGIALALDLTLRARFDLSLDGFMRAMWVKYGKTEVPYDVADLKATLGEYTKDAAFAASFFGRFIEGHEVADYTELLASVGLQLRQQNPGRAWLGAELRPTDTGLVVGGYPTDGSPLYTAGLSAGDIITSVRGARPSETTFSAMQPGSRVPISYIQRGTGRTATVVLVEDPTVEVVTFESADIEIPVEVSARRKRWLTSRVG
jgi:predicted metalloprotease with PDZ domain